MLLTLGPRMMGLTTSHTYRTLHSSAFRRSGLTNMLAGSSIPAVQVQAITSTGQIELASGMRLSGPCIFLGGKVFLWDVPQSKQKVWDGWGKEHFEIFDIVVPKPGIFSISTMVASDV